MTTTDLDLCRETESVQDFVGFKEDLLHTWREFVLDGSTVRSFRSFVGEVTANQSLNPIITPEAQAEWRAHVAVLSFLGSLEEYIIANCWCNAKEMHGETGQDVTRRSPCLMHPPAM
jgi:hypothetical protein